jgi:hypothetical protein
MSLPLSLRAVSPRDWLTAVSLIPLTAFVIVDTHVDAVANKLIQSLGVSNEVKWGLNGMIKTVLAPAEGAGEQKIKNLLFAVIALVLLGALVFFLFGVFRTLGGRRGGIESVGQVLFAIILAIAGLEILE